VSRVVQVLWERSVALPLSGRSVCLIGFRFIDLKRTKRSAARDRERRRFMAEWDRLLRTPAGP